MVPPATGQQSRAEVPDGTRVFADLAYVPDGRDRQKLDLYLPAECKDCALLVWVHGGAWRAGDKQSHPALPFLRHGYAEASINYRLSQHATFPAQIEDCKTAIRWLRAHTAAYGYDPAHIGVWGAFAGGHLVALLGTTGNVEAFDKGGHRDQSSRVQAVVDFFGPTDGTRVSQSPSQTEREGRRGRRLNYFGLETLAWARKGAAVTGVDFSAVAIRLANQLKAKAKLDAEFVCADLGQFGERACANFDIVFVSYGSLCWLPDLEHWARVVSKNLKIGGALVLVEVHPIYDFTSGYPYFPAKNPDVAEETTYTENSTREKMPVATWAHSLSEVINSILHAGIRIDRVDEYPFSPYNCFENLEEREPGRFYVANVHHPVPVVYAIKGTRE